MSLSLASTSFTTLPSIFKSPLLISSSPAIILSVVDLPQPDGPTNIMKSLSSISKLKSFTASKPFGYILHIFSNDKLAIFLIPSNLFIQLIIIYLI